MITIRWQCLDCSTVGMSSDQAAPQAAPQHHADSRGHQVMAETVTLEILVPHPLATHTAAAIGKILGA